MGWVIDAAGTPLDIADGTTYNVLSQDAPMPDVDAQYATSVDSPADRITSSRYKNRTITLKLVVVGADAAGLETAIGSLQQKVAKLNRDAIVDGDGIGGTLTYTSPTSTTVTFDVCKASVSAEMGWTHTHGTSTTADLVFECWPFGRGAENTPSDHTETTLPVLNFTESSVGGDVPALARLVVDEDQSKDQQMVLYGVRSRHYSADVTAGLFWQCEALTAVGAGATTTSSGYAGTASGSSNNVVYANALTTTYQDLTKSTVVGSALTSVTGSNSTDTFTKSTHGMVNNAQVVLSAKTGGSGLSTTTTYYVVASATNTFQLALTPGGTAVDLGSDVSSVTVTPTTYWTHIGSYRVLVRAQPKSTNTGTVSLRASWAQADVTNYTQGVAASCDAGNWTLVDLGVVSVPVVTTGTQRWELRIQGCSTVSLDDVYLDYIILVPVDEASGVAQVSSNPTTNTQTVADTFDQTAGNLNGKTPSPQTDGNWVESTAGHFAVDASAHNVQRTGTGDSAGVQNGSFAVASSATTGQYAQVLIGFSAAPAAGWTSGLVLRYTDASNWAAAVMYSIGSGHGYCKLLTCVAGSVSERAVGITGGGLYLALVAGSTYTLQAACYTNGRFDMNLYRDGTSQGSLTATNTVLATGGTLASGKVGIVDHYTSGTACTRAFDDFVAGTSLTDAACFAGQSIQFASDSTVRSVASGIWSEQHLEGDQITIPASGKEARPVEVIVKMSRAPLGVSGDEGIDDLSAKLYVQPRYLQLPA